jgi:protein-S-isoprenylcysteine O-methyltransferase Ste14
MKSSMTLFGCGPKLALLSLPYIILSSIVMYTYPDFFDLGFLNTPYAKVTGIIWFSLGVTYWMYSAIFFLKYFKPGTLLTRGPFALCRNPIYSSLIVFVIPSIGLLLHSGLILSISVVLYIGFKISIHGETIVLKRTFGEEYEFYERSVHEIVPIPKNLIKGRV